MSDTEDDLVAYFASLAPDARAELDGLAERDRRFGEDALAEQQAEGSR